MKRIIAPVIAGVLVLGLLSGCDAKEREALKGQVTSLQQELVTVNNALAAKESELTSLRTELQTAKDAEAQAVAQVAVLTTDLETVKLDLETALAGKKKK
jgi:septal ring factor EnvC (AmiA/AmiB activator)